MALSPEGLLNLRRDCEVVSVVGGGVHYKRGAPRRVESCSNDLCEAVLTATAADAS